MRFSLTRVISLIVVVWAFVSVMSASRNAMMRGADPVAALETEFRALSQALPRSGPVGFLRYEADDERADRVMTYYVAQYTLAPRVVEKRTDLEFVIVAPDALRAGADDRLAGFMPIATSKQGYSVYQRRAQ